MAGRVCSRARHFRSTAAEVDALAEVVAVTPPAFGPVGRSWGRLAETHCCSDALSTLGSAGRWRSSAGCCNGHLFVERNSGSPDGSNRSSDGQGVAHTDDRSGMAGEGLDVVGYGTVVPPVHDARHSAHGATADHDSRAGSVRGEQDNCWFDTAAAHDIAGHFVCGSKQ